MVGSGRPAGGALVSPAPRVSQYTTSAIPRTAAIASGARAVTRANVVTAARIGKPETS
jgi:hypothetical protein